MLSGFAIKVFFKSKSYRYGCQKILYFNSGFYTKDFQESPDNIKYKDVAKFEPMMLVWCAISEAGTSEPLIGQVRCQALNADHYIEQCLPTLIDFVQKFHAQYEIIFWLDLASCHYAKITTNCLRSKNVNFVLKEHNPPSVQ